MSGRAKGWMLCLLTVILWGILLQFPARGWEITGTGMEEPKYLALTFDDGPCRGVTARLLDGLAERGGKATFFLIGRQVEGCKDLVARMAEEGHQLGLHTWSHVALDSVIRETFLREMNQTKACLQKITGEETYMLRPPFGFVSKSMQAWADMPLICWSVDPVDWAATDAKAIARTLIETVTDGDIILMHDLYDSSVEAALSAMDQLMAQGYYFVTVEELFALRGREPQAGKVYTALPP